MLLEKAGNAWSVKRNPGHKLSLPQQTHNPSRPRTRSPGLAASHQSPGSPVSPTSEPKTAFKLDLKAKLLEVRRRGQSKGKIKRIRREKKETGRWCVNGRYGGGLRSIDKKVLKCFVKRKPSNERKRKRSDLVESSRKRKTQGCVGEEVRRQKGGRVNGDERYKLASARTAVAKTRRGSQNQYYNSKPSYSGKYKRQPSRHARKMKSGRTANQENNPRHLLAPTLKAKSKTKPHSKITRISKISKISKKSNLSRLKALGGNQSPSTDKGAKTPGKRLKASRKTSRSTKRSKKKKTKEGKQIRVWGVSTARKKKGFKSNDHDIDHVIEAFNERSRQMDQKISLRIQGRAGSGKKWKREGRY